MRNGAVTRGQSPVDVHVVVTCTDRKRLQPPPSLRISTLTQHALAARLGAWSHALETVRAPLVPATTLYSGDQWYVARSIPAAAPLGTRVRMWIASAGYGLIKPETAVKPYAATFAPNHADSVVPPDSAFRPEDWWLGLGGLRETSADCPATIADLAKAVAARNGDFLLVAASEPYVRAMMDDLEAAAKLLPDRFALICAGLRTADLDPPPNERAFLMPSEARLRTTVGGALHSLNARLARKAIAEAHEWVASSTILAEVFQRWIDASLPAPHYTRERLSDDEVRMYIRDELRESRRVTHTSLLRSLRDSGQACEQARFRRLFVATTRGSDEHDGSGGRAIGPHAT